MARLLDRLELVILCITGAGVVLLVFAGVISRYVFHFSMAWTEELSRYLFVWGSFIGAAAAFRTGEHRGIPLLRHRLPRLARRILDVATAAAVFTFLGVLTWQAWKITERAYMSGQASTTTDIPVWIVNCGLLIGVAFAMVRFAQFLVATWSDRDDTVTVVSGDGPVGRP